MKKVLIIFLVFGFGVLSAGGTGGFNPHYKLPALYTPSFINMNKVDVHHSMSVSAGYSNSGTGSYQSMYTNHIDYYIHPKVSLKMKLHFVNYGTADVNSGFEIEGNNDNRSAVLPEFQLQYKPTENTLIRLEYRQRGYSTSRPGSFSNWWDDWQD
ncbi:MAG: hypothetical protein K8S56_05520 [Candidatus Cloacimonetes bacterium]|nr:hypothetical protein [Candidatus Cloacimonadota bacterium]